MSISTRKKMNDLGKHMFPSRNGKSISDVVKRDMLMIQRPRSAMKQ